MLVDAQDKFLDRMAATLSMVESKEGKLKAAARMTALPVAARPEVYTRYTKLKRSA